MEDQTLGKLNPIWGRYLPFTIALVATLGSLFFSEVMNLPPCVLCWYQRIFMYPLPFLLLIGIWKNEDTEDYIWPLSAIGLVIATYHNLLYYGVISESLTPCTSGVSCTSRQIEWLGFITIPLLSLTAFALIFGLTFLQSLQKKRLK